MRGELRTTNSFGGRREGTSERAAAIRFVMKEVLHSLFRSSVRSFHRPRGTESICNERILRHFQYLISIQNFWQRFNSSSMLLFPLPLLGLCQFRRMRSPCRVIISLRASRPAYSPNYPVSSRNTAAPPSSLRSIGGGSAYFHGVSSPPSAPTSPPSR